MQHPPKRRQIAASVPIDTDHVKTAEPPTDAGFKECPARKRIHGLARAEGSETRRIEVTDVIARQDTTAALGNVFQPETFLSIPERENLAKRSGREAVRQRKACCHGLNGIKFLKKVKYYKGVISYKYVYDSFLNGQLLDLNDKSVFEKYQLQ